MVCSINYYHKYFLIICNRNCSINLKMIISVPLGNFESLRHCRHNYPPPSSSVFSWRLLLRSFLKSLFNVKANLKRRRMRCRMFWHYFRLRLAFPVQGRSIAPLACLFSSMSQPFCAIIFLKLNASTDRFLVIQILMMRYVRLLPNYKAQEKKSR